MIAWLTTDHVVSTVNLCLILVNVALAQFNWLISKANRDLLRLIVNAKKEADSSRKRK
jgi:hypothetical protein